MVTIHENGRGRLKGPLVNIPTEEQGILTHRPWETPRRTQHGAAVAEKTYRYESVVIGLIHYCLDYVALSAHKRGSEEKRFISISYC